MTQQDKALKRSYLQRSVVLVTHLPRLHGLFGKVAEMLSAVNLQTPDKFSVLLEVACNSIARWSACASSLDLPEILRPLTSWSEQA